MHSILLRTILLGSLLGSYLLSSAATAATPEITQPQVLNPARVLFVGNSYYYYKQSRQTENSIVSYNRTLPEWVHCPPFSK